MGFALPMSEGFDVPDVAGITPRAASALAIRDPILRVTGFLAGRTAAPLTLDFDRSTIRCLAQFMQQCCT